MRSVLEQIPEDRLQEYYENGITEDDILDCIEKGFDADTISKGYVFAVGRGDIDIPNAVQVQRLDNLPVFYSDEKAREQAERDGVRLIYDIPHIERGVYLDTSENRKICEEALENHPEYHIENILVSINDFFKKDYLRRFPDTSIATEEKIIRVSDIEWDTDGEDVTLPKEVIIENPTQEMLDDVDGYADAVGDYLSDTYGFCVSGFNAEVFNAGDKSKEAPSVKERLMALGMKEEDFGRYESDLYVRVTPVSTKFLESYPFKNNVERFVDNIEHVPFYDFPFAALKEKVQAEREAAFAFKEKHGPNNHPRPLMKSRQPMMR